MTVLIIKLIVNAVVSDGARPPEEVEADLKYVESQGKGIEAGANDIQNIKNEMEQLGAQPLIAKTGNETATGKGIDESNANCELKSWVREIRIAMISLFELAAEWHSIALNDQFDITIYNDYAVALTGTGDVEALIKLHKARSITGELLLRETQRRGLIAETVDVEAEFKAAQDEEVSISGLLGNLAPDLEDDGDGEE